ncbi:unnamed protein product, partial [Gulo gulo]
GVHSKLTEPPPDLTGLAGPVLLPARPPANCLELSPPAEHIYQYPDGPRLYTRASHAGSHRGHLWQTPI